MKPFIISTALFLAFFSNAQAQAWGDFTLYSLQNSTTAQLMNNAQVVVKTWSFAAADKTGYSSHLMPGGSIIRAVSRTGNSFTGGPICGKIQKHDWAGNLTWDFVYSTTQYCTHHDICPMPNGNVLVIAYEARTAAEATAKGATNGIVMWPDKIVEIQPTGLTTGTVVWEWKIWDHTCQNTDAAKPGYVTSIADNPQLLNINYKTAKDWIHMNGVDYNPILDQITFSSHNLNEWYVIDHSTTTAEAASHTGGLSGKGGDFLYRWGNPAAYSATGTAILNVTHDAHWIPEGTPNAGRLVGFNNKGVSASQSAVDQVMPPRVGYNYTRAAGAAFAPATYDARHAASGYSSNMGSSQQLPNGNMLVCVATAGKVYEIDAVGTQIWTKTFSGSCPQSFKYDSCFVFNQPPAIPTITQSCAGLTLPTATTYQWYMNGDLIAGANAQTYTPTQSGNYVGRITDANGCVYRYAPTFKYTLPTAIVATATSTPTEVGASTGTATTTVSGGTAPYTYVWNDLTIPQSASISGLSAGTYCVTITDANCTTQTACADVLAIVSTQNQTESIIFGLSPNPNNGVLTIKTDIQNYNITLTDINGKTLATEPNAKTMDLTAFANGVYFVTLKTTAGAQKTQRITLQK